ncbi:MAG TPA: chemotaxis protein CheW [Polyangiaceae bacterium]|jgi:two-component system chemotaxis sensor kinase CheA
MDLTFLRAEYVAETTPLVADIEATLLELEGNLERGEGEPAPLWRRLMNALHTIKGNSGIIGFTAGQSLAHAMEDRCKRAEGAALEVQLAAVRALLGAADALRDAIPVPMASDEKLEAARRELLDDAEVPEAGPERPRPQESVYASYAVARVADVRIGADKLDRLLELVGELATHHNRVADVLRNLALRVASSDAEAASAADALDQLGKTIAEFRGGITQARLLPLTAALNRFRRLVRDLCVTTQKRAVLEVSGADTVVDKAIVDAIGEPLLHLLRNAVDHGLETPEARAAAGKPVEGKISLSIRQQGGELQLTVRDDGRGISRAKLVARAAERGITAQGWVDGDVLQLIFLPDISTAERVTELSGRGVGLDAARKAVERIGGTLDVTSEEGKGTEFDIRVPLTLTLQRVLLLQRRGEVYAAPLGAVQAIVRAGEGDIHSIDRRTFLRFRARLLPAHDLALLLGIPGEDAGEHASLCVVLEDGARACALIVDAVLGQQDVVLKELDATCGRPVGIAGATVLADGHVAMVLDARAIAASLRRGGGSLGVEGEVLRS